MELEGNIAELERSQRSMEATHKDSSNQAEQREASFTGALIGRSAGLPLDEGKYNYKNDPKSYFC